MSDVSKNLLLLTSSPPGRSGVGAIYLRDMLRLLPDNSVHCAALCSRHQTWDQSNLPDSLAARLIVTRRFEPAFAPLPGAAAQGIARAAQAVRFVPYVRRLRAEIERFARQCSADALWSVLACPTSIEMTAALARRLKIPLYSLVWDVPEVAIRAFGHRGMSLRHLLRRFDQAIRGSTRVAVVSQLLQEEYQCRYGVETVLLRHAVEPALVRTGPPPRGPDEPFVFVIGFAGSLTAAAELQGLQAALDSVGWRIAGREVILRLFGMRYVLESAVPRRIEYRGLLPDTPEIMEALAECDLMYLPQPFDPQQRQLARGSFPTKLSTYLAAGRPVLVHGPEYASIVDFCRQHPVGACCTDAGSEALLATLMPLASDREVYDRAVSDAQSTCRNQFHVDVTRRQLFRFLGLTDEDKGQGSFYRR